MTSLRPDIVVYSDSANTVIMIELTCPSEENFQKQHEAKLARYTDITFGTHSYLAFEFIPQFPPSNATM